MRLWLTFGLGVAVVHVALGFVNVSATALWEKIVKAAKDAGASAEQLSNGLTEAVGSLGHGVITVGNVTWTGLSEIVKKLQSTNNTGNDTNNVAANQKSTTGSVTAPTSS